MLHAHLLLVSFAGIVLSSPFPVQQPSAFGSDTQNGLSGACKAITIIFARGTTETGNVGSIVGPPFFQALCTKLGSDRVAFQGVDYPADVPGFLEGGDPQGSQTM